MKNLQTIQKTFRLFLRLTRVAKILCTGEAGNSFSVTTGIFLILASLIFRYGAELEQQPKRLNWKTCWPATASASTIG